MSIRNEVDMTHGPLAKKIILFALPLAFSSMLQQLFNAADLAVVGRFATSQAMAAVGSNASVISLLVNLFTGLSVGANVVVANLLGAGKRERVNDAVHTVMAVAGITGFLVLALGLIVANPILSLMGAPEDVIGLASVYLRIYFLGMPAIMLYNFGAAILRSRGDSRRPVFALTLAGVVNVLLNLLFVAVFHLHVIGVALATVLSNCLSGGLVVFFLMNEEGEFRLEPRRLRIRADILRDVVRIGLPAGLQRTVFSISNVVIQSAVNSFGSACIAGMTAAQNLDFISFCLISSFDQTCTTFTSQNYGAKEPERCKKVWRLSMGLGLATDFVLLGAILLLRHQLIGIFTTDPEVARFAMIRIRYAACVHFLCATYEITAGALRGMNRSIVPALISLMGTCAVRLLYVIFVFPHFGTPQALILVYPITWIITGVAMNTAYFIERNRLFLAMEHGQ